jgi:hypothetical protein
VAKFTFNHMVEWSDWSEFSPQHQGQLPCAVILPDGKRVELDEAARYAAYGSLYRARMEEGSKATYAQIHPNVRFRENHWGDDGSRRMGRAGSKLEVLAPKESKFLFARVCPWCGGQAGEQELSAIGPWPTKAKSLYHDSCKAEEDEQERLIAEQYREIDEQERLAEESWQREYGHLLEG